jgi:hypothetical protein
VKRLPRVAARPELMVARSQASQQSLQKSGQACSTEQQRRTGAACSEHGSLAGRSMAIQRETNLSRQDNRLRHRTRTTVLRDEMTPYVSPAYQRLRLPVTVDEGGYDPTCNVFIWQSGRSLWKRNQVRQLRQLKSQPPPRVGGAGIDHLRLTYFKSSGSIPFRCWLSKRHTHSFMQSLRF